MGRYNVHAGHNPAGKVACGAVGLLNESTEARRICKEIVRLLKLNGHTVYNCTVNNGTGQSDVLKKIVAKCNAHNVDFDFSIHLNSGRGDKMGDGSIGGFEVLVTGTGKYKGEIAERMRSRMKELGFKDRGTKIRDNLYVLNHTEAPALLLEICFVDDRDDYELYEKVSYKIIARELVKAIMDKDIIMTAECPDYKVGKTYILQSEMQIRKGPGMEYKKKTYEELTAAGQKCDKDKDGALAKGTKVTVKEIKRISFGKIWIRISSGWLKAVYNGKVYVK